MNENFKILSNGLVAKEMKLNIKFYPWLQWKICRAFCRWGSIIFYLNKENSIINDLNQN